MSSTGSMAYGFSADSQSSETAESVDRSAVVYVTPADAQTFAQELLVAHGLPNEDAAMVADALVSADLRGVSTHGIVRLPGYIERLRRGMVEARPDITVRNVTPVCAHVDGGNGLGFVVGNRAVDVAVELATSGGAGVAAVMRSNHFGMAGSYALRAVRAGMIGIVMTNASRAMPPFGGREPLLGTGPMAIGAPGGLHSNHFVFDMSPAVVARGKIRLSAQHGEPIPLGYALDSEGRPTTDPVEALKGVLLPMGGPKGSGLALAIEILCGVLTGAAFGGEVRDQYKDFDRPQNVGHLMIALKPDLFMPLTEYQERMDFLAERVHQNSPQEGVERVVMPGEIELDSEKKRRVTGIPVGMSELEVLQHEANAKGVPELPYSAVAGK
ncbi:Ldh family oxidoreductase [Jatrophihabitans sp. DSM 45814]